MGSEAAPIPFTLKLPFPSPLPSGRALPLSLGWACLGRRAQELLKPGERVKRSVSGRELPRVPLEGLGRAATGCGPEQSIRWEVGDEV